MFKNIFRLTFMMTLVIALLTPEANAQYTDEDLFRMYTDALEDQKTTFDDIDTVSWAVKPITELAKRGIVSGTGNMKFSPNNPVSRIEFIKMITGTCGIVDTESQSNYTDVEKNHWSYPFVSSAKKAGLTDIYSETFLNANVSISREDICYMSVKALRAAGIETSANNTGMVFDDENQMSSYAKDAIYELYSLGVINGRGNGIFSPKDSATRAESAKIIYNVLMIIEENF